jgi:hypothetical protein
MRSFRLSAALFLGLVAPALAQSARPRRASKRGRRHWFNSIVLIGLQRTRQGQGTYHSPDAESSNDASSGDPASH